ncbi:E3 ubiquitin-protein ligase TRIM71 [Oopsacas minuta]|uniref:E3 ubiquitin-protein ligase TRIM71 n=1 Tax=Oopsacas minuta TaxID=111878 RepID=A0AAV7K2Z2_9METZ|nr:E3 ubiquitin-protein ligase TRIM71 [Oopsacas minuta]
MANRNFRSSFLKQAEVSIDRLREEIRQKRTEVKVKFADFREALDKKEVEIYERLDSILLKVIKPVTHTRAIIEQLIEGTAAVEGKFEHNELHRFRTETLERIEQEIQELEERPLAEIPSAKLKWDLNLLDRTIMEVCQVVEGPCPYEERGVVMMACGDKGSGEEEIFTPTGVAIDEENGDIYVADCNMNRIQIFSDTGKYQSTIRDIDYPRRLILDTHNIFVTCNISGGALIKLNKMHPQDRYHKSEGEYISDITFDKNNRILGCVYSKPIVIIWDKDLKKIEEVQLHTQHFEKGTTKSQKVVATHNAIIVLFTGSCYPLQSFIWKGYALRPIIYNDQLSGAKMFCQDYEGNFIIVNNQMHEVKIFTPEGKYVTTLGVKGEEKGTFTDPLSVAVTRSGRIIVLDMKKNLMIQMF